MKHAKSETRLDAKGTWILLYSLSNPDLSKAVTVHQRLIEINKTNPIT